MIDIHSHILPLVDDGSKSVDMSLEMLDQAYKDGTEEIILTPHLAYAYGFDNPREKIENLFEEFRNIVWDVGIPIKLHLGCEFLYSTKESFEKHFKDITTLADTKYLLVEFYFDVNEDVILEEYAEVLEESDDIFRINNIKMIIDYVLMINYRKNDGIDNDNNEYVCSQIRKLRESLFAKMNPLRRFVLKYIICM